MKSLIDRTRIPLFYNLEGSLITEQGDRIDETFKDVIEAVAFIKKYDFLYTFKGARYNIIGGVECQHLK